MKKSTKIIAGVLGAGAAASGVLVGACGVIYNQLVWKKPIEVPKFIAKMIAGNEAPNNFEAEQEKAFEHFKSLPLENVKLKTADGAGLIARILIPEKSNGKLIIACHGARSTGLGEFAFMSDYLYKSGYTVILPDHRGCGESDGKFMGYGTHESRDTFLWVDFAKKRYPDMPIFLLGVSMGGATVLMMSEFADDEQIKGVIADCPYTSAWDEFSYQMKTSFHLPEFPILQICDMFSRKISGYSFKDASPLKAVQNAKKPILFIHGEEDDFVPYFMRDILYDACVGEKYKLTVPGAVHARSYYTDPAAYEAALEEFIEKCLKNEKKQGEAILEKTIRLTPSDEKTNITIPFEVEKGVKRLCIRASYSPKILEDEKKASELVRECLIRDTGRDEDDYSEYLPLKNLVTLSLDSPSGYRGAAHRHSPNQTLVIGEDEASFGFTKGKIEVGQWTAVINIHAVVTDYCDYNIHITTEVN